MYRAQVVASQHRGPAPPKLHSAFVQRHRTVHRVVVAKTPLGLLGGRKCTHGVVVPRLDRAGGRTRTPHRRGLGWTERSHAGPSGVAEMPTTTGRRSGTAHHRRPDGGTPGGAGNDPPATKKQYRIKLHSLEGKKRLDLVDVYDLRSPPSIRLD